MDVNPIREENLLLSAEKALLQLQTILSENKGQKKIYHQGFETVGYACSRGIEALKDAPDLPDWLKSSNRELIDKSMGNLANILSEMNAPREIPYTTWKDCHKRSDQVSYALFFVEKVIRAALSFLISGLKKESHEQQFFKGPDTPKALKDAILDLENVSEEIADYLKPNASPSAEKPV
ncbi:MAG: hypothetical protein K0U37_05870 [Gammaproteobacteria bacterium]|nr:hypothetical protein [Gammaproteobacteria bacterium]